MIKHPTLYKDETGELFLEMFKGVPIIHCYIYKWSKDNYKKHKIVWEEVVQHFKNKGFPAMYAARKKEDTKLKKYAEKFGFEDTDEELLDSNGNLRRVMKCDLMK